MIEKIKRFFVHDLWHTERKDVSAVKYFFIAILQRLIIAVNFFTTKRVTDMAAALTYSTLFAVVPICAVVFAIARGFGFSKYIEMWFKDLLSSQPQAAEAIIGFVNSYLVHTKSGVILGIGLLFMLWTVLMLTSNIEKAFNTIWQVKQPRSIFRTITDYLTMFFLIPIIIVLTSGLSILMATVADRIAESMLLGPIMHGLMLLTPYVLMSMIFTGLFIFMPNTHVKLKAAIVPGILAGISMQILQLIYINSQIFLSSYNAIYGSFAALPLFMFWVQCSWLICLFFAQLSYTNQNVENFFFGCNIENLSHRYKLLLSGVILSKICKRFRDGRKGYTLLELKEETSIPVRILQELLCDLKTVNLVVTSRIDEKHEIDAYYPAEDLSRVNLGTMVDRLESNGSWNLNVNVKELLENIKWQEFYNVRKGYLEDLSQVPLYDLE